MHSDRDEIMKIMEMSEIELLRYTVDRPFYLTDLYYAKFGGAIKNRAAALERLALRSPQENEQ